MAETSSTVNTSNGTKDPQDSSNNNNTPKDTSTTTKKSSSTTTTVAAAVISSSNPTAPPPPTDTTVAVSDVLEERLIDAEYKIWKKNTPYLYDLVMTHALEWPSLTCQWLPNVKQSTSDMGAEEHSLLLGTFTTPGEQNYLMVCGVNLPKMSEDGSSDGNAVVPSNNGSSATSTGAAAAATASSGGNAVDGGSKSGGVTVIPAAHYDEEKSEIGGFGFSGTLTSKTSAPSHPVDGKIEIKMKLLHEGEVNRARYCPKNHFLVATKGPSPYVYIFDLSKHPSFPKEDEAEFCPQFVLAGHDSEGYGLAWNPHKEGEICSGSEDKKVCLWDINNPPKSSSDKKGESSSEHLTIDPLTTFLGHEDVIEDVDWHKLDPNLIGSCGDDGHIMLWDVRQRGTINGATHVIRNAHEKDIHCIEFHPTNEFLLASGSVDKTVALWDMRNLKSRIQTLTGHTDQILQVSWSPFNESILASCSADRRVNIWDLSRIGMEQSPEDAQDGPPELLFMHGGHTSKVSDFHWNANDPWTISSVSEDNVLQVWTMAEEIYAEDDEDEEGDGVEEGDMEVE